MLNHKPALSLAGCDNNCFILLTRAKRALRDAGATAEDVRIFDLLVGGNDVRRYPTCQMPGGFYERMLVVVNKWCTVLADAPDAISA